jgi:cytochrome d ubiquinol oxidase subunit I
VPVPRGLSLLAYGDPDAVVRGLEEFPAADRPHPVVHLGFQVMVLLGTGAALWAALTLLFWLLRRRLPDDRRWLWLTVALGPAGVVAMEAGWIVTEVGRQPWSIYGVLRTADAATPVGSLWVPFALFAIIYLGLAAAAALVFWREVRKTTGEAPA